MNPRILEPFFNNYLKVKITMAEKKYIALRARLLLTLACFMFFSLPAGAACRNPNFVMAPSPWIVRAAASDSGFVNITWFGHSFFQITSSKGTKIITDPFRYLGYPMPEVWPHVVTVGKETGNHNNVGLANGEPLVLRGMKPWGIDWNEVSTTVRDVLIYNVPIHNRAWVESFKGSAFVFEMDGLCITHVGDLGLPFNEDQLNLLGHIDILLVPIGGRFSMGPENAKQVIAQLKPKIAVPMHYRLGESQLERLLDGPYPARHLKTGTFSVSKDTLPPSTEIFIPRVVWHGYEED
ncbi:MAG: MBL fold metallo-hydrolase [Desulfobacterales bacterium]|nr:MBL fold metallo-hydrolase [Desulfobacterales bacterium]